MTTKIPPHSEKFIPISILISSLSNNRDYIFKPTLQTNIVLFAHIINSIIIAILIRNNLNREVEIPQKLKLDTLTEINYENYFQTDLSPEYISIAFSRKTE